MKTNLQKLDKKAKISLLTSTLVLAVFVIFVFNVLFSTVYFLELIKNPDFETINVSFKEGFYAINEKKVGVSIFFNMIGILIVWFLMLSHTLKSINKSVNYIFL
ncbi:hypothetical protein [Flavobacterium sp.]|uniref:hypothetical protein n=1 Tax=Flavobacterium sp. TaxID=239 RepID=UPI00261C7BE2|nr:hypothetical protein [Flavobacterium sp.]